MTHTDSQGASRLMTFAGFSESQDREFGQSRELELQHSNLCLSFSCSESVWVVDSEIRVGNYPDDARGSFGEPRRRAPEAAATAHTRPICRAPLDFYCLPKDSPNRICVPPSPPPCISFKIHCRFVLTRVTPHSSANERTFFCFLSFTFFPPVVSFGPSIPLGPCSVVPSLTTCSLTHNILRVHTHRPKSMI